MSFHATETEEETSESSGHHPAASLPPADGPEPTDGPGARPSPNSVERQRGEAMFVRRAIWAALCLDGIGFVLAYFHVATGGRVLESTLGDIFLLLVVLAVVVRLFFPQIGDPVSRHRPRVFPSADRSAGNGTVPDEARIAELVAARTEELERSLARAHREIMVAHERHHLFRGRLQLLATRPGPYASGSPDSDLLLGESVRSLGALLEADVVAVFVADRGQLASAPILWTDGFMDTQVATGLTEEDEALTLLSGPARNFVESVLETGETVVLSDVASLGPMLKQSHWRQMARLSRLAAVVIAPVVVNSRRLGVLAVGMTSGPRTWSDDELTLVDVAVADVGRTMVQAELVRRQLALVDQLHVLDRSRQDLMTAFSREFSDSLATINAETRDLRRHLGHPSGVDRLALGAIEGESERLHQMIENVLAISRATPGSTGVVLEKVDLGRIVRSVTDGFVALAETRQQRLVVHVPPQPVVVPGDEILLVVAVKNLVRNALNFTPSEGTVEVVLAEARRACVLSVTDTGVGIPDDEREVIFDRFVQGSTISPWLQQGERRGGGLGLSAVQAAVAAHHGALSLTSAVPGGTTVEISLALPERR